MRARATGKEWRMRSGGWEQWAGGVDVRGSSILVVKEEELGFKGVNWAKRGVGAAFDGKKQRDKSFVEVSWSV